MVHDNLKERAGSEYDWFAKILYPKILYANTEEVFYVGDTVLVTYESSFNEPRLQIICYQKDRSKDPLTGKLQC